MQHLGRKCCTCTQAAVRTTGSAMVRASAVYSSFVLTRDSTCCGYLASRLRITNRRAGTNTWEELRCDLSASTAHQGTGTCRLSSL